jgi:hypothetical protein
MPNGVKSQRMRRASEILSAIFMRTEDLEISLHIFYPSAALPPNPMREKLTTGLPDVETCRV